VTDPTQMNEARVEPLAQILNRDLDYVCAGLGDEYAAMAGKRLLITGGGGFLGYYMVQGVLHWNDRAPVRDRIHVTVFDNYVRGVEAYAVPGTRNGYTLRVEEYPGEGFLFAVVTLDPIAFASFSRGGTWDDDALGLASRVTGDPYVLFGDLLAALVPETYPDVAWAVLPYSVGARHDYPRFRCYQCHAYVSPVVWDPYAHSCIRIGIPEPVWWSYPAVVYGGTSVIGPPRRLPPGFVGQPRTPRASPVGPRDRSTPVAGAPAGRRPAPVAAAPQARPSARGAPNAAPTRRAEAPAASARRPASGPSPVGRSAAPKAREATGATGRRTGT